MAGPPQPRCRSPRGRRRPGESDRAHCARPGPRCLRIRMTILRHEEPEIVRIGTSHRAKGLRPMNFRREDLLRRGLSRRDLGRLAALFTTGAALPFWSESTLAQGLSARRDLPPDAVRINANE